MEGSSYKNGNNKMFRSERAARSRPRCGALHQTNPQLRLTCRSRVIAEWRGRVAKLFRQLTVVIVDEAVHLREE